MARASLEGKSASGLTTLEIPPNFPDFSSITTLNLVGDASQKNGNLLRPIPSSDAKQVGPFDELVGGAWFSTKQPVRDGFKTNFQFRIANQRGNDGIAFVIQNFAASALGTYGDALGYHQLPNSVAVEFDFERETWTIDPDGNHISVHTLGTRGNDALETASIGVVSPNIDMSNGEIHSVEIEYVPGAIFVSLDEPDSPILEVPIDISDTLNLDNGRAWVGFTAGGRHPEFSHDMSILSWTFNPLTMKP